MSDQWRSEAESAFLLGDILARQGDVASATGAFHSAIAMDDPEWSPQAAYHLGGRGLPAGHRAGPFRAEPQGGREPRLRPVQPGRMVEEAEEAFQIAIDSDDAEQAQLARQNLAAMRQLTAERQQGERHWIV